MKKIYLTPEVEIISTIASKAVLTVASPGGENGTTTVPDGGLDNSERAEDSKEFIWFE